MIIELCGEKTCLRGFTNWTVYSQKMTRGLKFRIKEVEGLDYVCCKNKGSDQLHSYCTADLHLCFGTFKEQVLHMTRLKLKYNFL